ncbi:helix-turn-helix domain-containing protein [Candidatus Saccharibacteria bacterium]|nr:helix-turn-helix domain-containing protein [Candidatus Saccharibacteria bacterium]
MDLKKIGKFIAKKRQEKGFTQEGLAEELDITNRSISKWERGICLPDAKNMAKLCKVLDITYNELLNGENIKEQDASKTAEQTVVRIVDYADRQVGKLRRILAYVFIAVGVIAIIVAASIFESGTHASMYGSVFGVLAILIGSSFILKKLSYSRRLLAYFIIFVASMGVLLGLDYLNVALNNVPPRFTYNIVTWNEMIYYDTPFYDVVRCYPDTENETWQIIENSNYNVEDVAGWNYCSAEK